MLFYLHQLGLEHEWLSFLRLFRYVTFRAGGAAFTAFLVTVILGPLTVRLLQHLQMVAPSRIGEYDPSQEDLIKKKVPSMGGLLILYSTVVAILLWAVPGNSLVHVFLFVIISLGLIGFTDDLQKVLGRKSSAGMAGRVKLLLQFVVGLIAVYWLAHVPETGGTIHCVMLPFCKSPVVTNLPVWAGVCFGCLVVVSASNAVNLTDGMDGLAAGCTVITALTFGVFAYICGHAIFATYLDVPFIPGCGEVVVIATAMAGAALGFLWHNCYPAKMFMGDTGSLSLGGAIGLIAVLVKQELVLVLIGGVFVAEALSVILQVTGYKLTRRLTGTPRRIFLCAPLHHHFKKLGWTETQVVVRFWILALLCAVVGLATLKIR